MALTRMITILFLALTLGGPALAGKTSAPAKKEPRPCGTGKAPCPCSIC